MKERAPEYSSLSTDLTSNHPTAALTKMVSNHFKKQSSSTHTIIVLHDTVSVVKYYKTATKKAGLRLPN
jgi:hypothetical protein